MAAVEALTTKEDVQKVQAYLLNNYSVHYADMWRLGVNLALRITDLLNLTMDDMRKGLRKGTIAVLESKTKRTNRPPRIIKLNSVAKEIISGRVDEYPHFEYLFQSESKNIKKIQPLSRAGIRNALADAGKKVGADLGTHSMRKSFGAIAYSNGVEVEHLQKIFCHDSPGTTLRYIGITQKTINDTYDDNEI